MASGPYTGKNEPRDEARKMTEEYGFKTFNCPKCGRQVSEYPALSRRDNETYICSRCGEIEAFEDYANAYKDNEGIQKFCSALIELIKMGEFPPKVDFKKEASE